MSEKIKITVVMDDEKQNKKNPDKQAAQTVLTQESSVTLMSVLLENRLMPQSLCGGRGDCGRCVVQFLEGVPLPTPLERRRLTPEELRQGFRLACVTRPKTDCVVRIVNRQKPERAVVTEMIPLSGEIDLSSQQNNLSKKQTSSAIEWEKAAGKAGKKAIKSADVILQNKTDVTDYIAAVDLGTTTIAMQLRELYTGKVLDTYCEMNPQRSYGADVLSRIQAACSGYGEELAGLVREAVARGLAQFVECLKSMKICSGETADDSSTADLEAGKDAAAKIVCMCIAGNTTMTHLLLGYDVGALGRSPFTPVNIELQELSIQDILSPEEDSAARDETITGAAGWEFPVYIAPGISAFVGGDIVAGLYALRMLSGRKRAALLIDLGTNGEMALTDGERMLTTATAAGPAFEGGANDTLAGTDRIALMAALLQRGILDGTGLLAEPYFTEGVPLEVAGNAGGKDDGRCTGDGKKNICYLYKEDIRALQMAKAAVRAGVEILWKELDCPEIDKVYLAGGFGYFLDAEAALAIGLLPEKLRGRIRAVGNTSLAGAYLLGRDLVTGTLTKEALEEAVAVTENGRLRAVNLAQHEDFERLYLQYMNLERN